MLIDIAVVCYNHIVGFSQSKPNGGNNMTEKIRKRFFLFPSVLILMILLGMTAFSADTAASVKNLKAYNTDPGITLKWTKSSVTSRYEIYKISSGSTERLAVVKSNSFTDKSVSDGQVYRYKVRSLNGKSTSAFAYVTCKRLATPKITGVTFENSCAVIKWSKCPNASGYILYRKVSKDGNWERIAEPSKNTVSYCDQGRKNGVSYYYTLKQVSGSFVSSFIRDGVGGTYLTAPKNLAVKNSPNGVRLTWSKILGNGKIEVFRKANGEWKKIAVLNSSKTSFYDSGALYSRKNSYLIRIVSPLGEKSGYSQKASLYAVNPKKKMVALTYDDGPYRPVTLSILDTLKKNGARATFFVVGSRLSTYSDCLRKEAEIGCEIGCHTYNHTTLTKASDAVIRKEIADTNALIKKYSGQTVKLVRAPGGSVNSHVKSVVAYPLVNWSVDTRDWSNRSSSVTYSNFKKSVKDGCIVLMHDLYPSTAEATKSIVSYLRKNGYQIVTVSEMMDAKGVTPTRGNLYTAAY